MEKTKMDSTYFYYSYYVAADPYDPLSKMGKKKWFKINGYYYKISIYYFLDFIWTLYNKIILNN